MNMYQKALGAIGLGIGTLVSALTLYAQETPTPQFTPHTPSPVATSPIPSPEPALPESEFSIVSWNLKNYGKTKAAVPKKVAAYAKEFSEGDIAVAQEIQDKSGKAIYAIANLMPDYNVILSSRAGSKGKEEQYAFFYRTESVRLLGFTDYAASHKQDFTRPPAAARFAIGDYQLTVVTIHTKPEKTDQELVSLEKLVREIPGRVIVIGDLNADCDYDTSMLGTLENLFAGWLMPINDADNTTVSPNNTCAYDRALIRADPIIDLETTIDRNYTLAFSDHYPVKETLTILAN